MAFAVQTGNALSVNIQFVDEADNQAGTVVTVPWNVDLATTLADASAVADAYAAASDAEVGKATVSLLLIDPVAAAAAVGSEVENEAFISAKLTDPLPDGRDAYGSIRIPAPKIDIFVAASGPNKNVVDTTDLLVTAITDKYAPAGTAQLGNGNTIDTVRYGKRVHKRSRSG